MTVKLFWEVPYLCTLDTRVASVADRVITLRETIFYAFSGGQESDTGTVGGRPVIEARTAGRDIEYILPADHDLKPGDQVCVEVDRGRRYRLMRLHFAAELILELVYRALDDVEKIGAHIGPDKARIDFAWPQNISGMFPRLVEDARRWIDRDIGIISAYANRAVQERYWEVPGFARVPCGGTHLRSTGEVGDVLLKRRNIGKGNERIEIRASAVGEVHNRASGGTSVRT